MSEQPCAFNMPQETDAESRSQVRSFDEAGKIGDDKSAAEFGAVAAGAAIRVHDAEIRFQCSERIVRNFWTRGGNHRNQSGLPSIWVTDQSGISQQLQLKTKMPLFAGESIFMFARSLV